MTLFDVWVLKNPRLAEMDRILSWTPIDHMPVPPKVAAWSGRQPNVTPVAMSKFGLEQLERKGLTAAYLPHTVSPTFRRKKGGGAEATPGVAATAPPASTALSARLTRD